jgi:hypothetical protein
MQRAYPDEMACAREWRKLAEGYGVEIVENETLAEQRMRRALDEVDAVFGDGD